MGFLIERFLELVYINLVEADASQHLLCKLRGILALNHDSDVGAAMLCVSSTYADYLRGYHTRSNLYSSTSKPKINFQKLIHALPYIHTHTHCKHTS